jgi:5-methyltetrahydropteroyltriglutamate--homocysteine methyltransferase
MSRKVLITAGGAGLGLEIASGFASTEEGNVLTEDEQWAKLARLVEVAREVWG